MLAPSSTAGAHERSPASLTGATTPVMVRRPMEEWQCIIQDAYPAYISWTQYTRQSSPSERQRPALYGADGLGRGPPRRRGLTPRTGHVRSLWASHVRRVSSPPTLRLYEYEAGVCRTQLCPSRWPSIEAFVVRAFFDAIAPAQLETLDEVLAQRQRNASGLKPTISSR